ncbi:PilZ domain-containing protein [Marinobacter sp. CHS3-4]|uniref:PilZ domain-containing protein n=1 Tax=Marinobacter sp. CHS3-4 TaxID=3045174 RepID=UPI0024B5BBB8|nr:PilZ domain-containing protein [Marinobacter sp. CHS3-4]MDI9245681.1 PilZ domain-containing protein [Marinobacter sp. CHS3-4]
MAAQGTDHERSDPNNLPEDRRDFYRISDRVGLQIKRQITEDSTPESLFNGDHLDTLRTEYRRLDQDVRSQLAALAERDRLLASLIKSVNGKLDTLERIMAFEQNPLQPEDWQEVTLSEGGLSFYSTIDDFAVGERIAVRLTLPPELYQPLATAEIVSVEPAEAHCYRIHTEFSNIHDADRQQIARYVFKWQIRQRQNE